MSQAMAELFRRFTSGVCVVGVAAQERHNAFTAAWIEPVSFQPLLLALSINPKHSSYQLLRDGGVFSANVLRRDQRVLAAHFGGPNQSRKVAKSQLSPWHPGKTGAPLLDGVLLQPKAEPLIYRDTDDMDGATA